MNKVAQLALALCFFAAAPSVRPEDEHLDDYGGGGGGGYGDDYGGYGEDGYGEGGGGGSDEPNFTILDDITSVNKFLKDEEPTEPRVIGFFNEETNKEDIEAFEEASKENSYGWRFAYTIEDDVRAHFKATSGAKVEVYKAPRFVSEKYDKPKARYPGKSVDSGALKKFMEKKALPLVGEKIWKNNDMYENVGLPILTLFTAVDLEKNSKGFDYFANRLRRVAVEYIGELSFNVGNKDDYSYQLEDYGLTKLEGKKDVGVGIKNGNKHYFMEESFSVENIKAFVEKFKAGSLTPKIKEEETHEEHDHEEDEEDDGSPSSVVTLTADNFEDEVMKDGVDAMVEFYAPWCGHCMQLKPTYKKLAAAFDGVPSVVVGAMDATAHEAPKGFDVQGYPSIYFLKDGEKEAPVSYDGPRDLDSMVQYIKENAAVPIKDEL